MLTLASQPEAARSRIAEVVGQVLREEHGDVIRESVKAVARELTGGASKSRRVAKDSVVGQSAI